MENGKKRYTSIASIFIGILASLLYWFFESSVHAFVLGEGSLAGQLISPDVHELYMRLVTVIMIMISSMAISYISLRPARLKKKLEEKALKEKEFSDFLVENLPDIFYVFDEKGRFLRWNKKLEEVTGYSAKEIARQTAFDHIRKEEKGYVAESVKEVFTKGEANIDVTFVSKTGKEIPYFCKGYRFERGGKPYLLGMGINISELKKTEKELGVFKRFAQNAGQGFGMAYPDGNVAYVNPELCEVFEEERPEDACKKNIRDYYPKFQYEKFVKEIAPTLKEKGRWTGESKILSSKGKIIPVIENIFTIEDEAGKLQYYANVITDITEQKKTQEEIRDARGKWENIFKAVGHPAMILDTDHVIQEVNEAVLELTGKKKEELIGRKCHELYHDTHEPPDCCPMEKLKKTRHFETEEMEVESFGGIFLVSCTPLLDKDGKLDKIIHIATDVTERKKAEEEVKKTKEYFKAITENSSDLVVITDKKGILTYTSVSAERVTGYKREELVGKSIFKFIHQSDLPRAMADYAKAIMTKDQIIPNSFRTLAKDGSERILEGVGKNLLDHPAIKGFIMNVRDVTEQKKAEIALKASEERLRRAVTEAPFPAMIHAEDGEVIELSNAWTEISGYTREEIPTIGDWTEKAYGERKESVRADIDKLYALDKRIDEGEYEVKTKSGEKRIWHFSSSPAGKLSDGRRLVISMADDETDRKKAEKALAESELRYRRLFETAKDAILILDVETKKIIDANPYIEELLEYNPGGIIGKEVHEISPLKDIVENKIRVETLLREKYIRYEDLPLETKNGKKIYVEVVGNTYKVSDRAVVQLNIRDITERRKIERALKKNELFLRGVFDGIQDGISVLDKDLNIVKTNKWIERMHAEDMPLGGKKCYEVYQKRKGPCPWCPTLETLKTGQVNSAVVPYPSEESPTGWMQLSTYPLGDEKGEVTGVIEHVKDITKQKKAEMELEKYRDHLEELVKERTEELESFSYSVSHDLRAPLRAIDGFSNILKEDYSERLDDEGKKVTSVIQENTRNMSQLIDDLLAFSRIGRQDIKVSEIDMKTLAREESERQTRDARERNINFDIKELPPAEGDRKMIQQALANLVSNSVKFTRTKEKADIEIGAKPEEGRNIYYVKDNGVGFDMEYKDKLFAVFQRLHAKDEFEGTGVGLAIVQRIVRRHGGDVWAEGKPGEGATFYFSLPKT